jgi:hypothetical protein
MPRAPVTRQTRHPADRRGGPQPRPGTGHWFDPKSRPIASMWGSSMSCLGDEQMKFQKNARWIGAAFVSAICLSSAYAGWGDGGLGVVDFPASNPSKILFTDRVRPGEASLGYGTDRTAYTTALKKSQASAVRNVYPAGSIPTVAFDPKVGGVDYTRLTIDGPLVWSNVSRSSGAPCRANQTGCPAPGQISVSSTCSYNKVKTIASGEISGGVAKEAKVMNAGYTASIGGSLSLTREWESGWEACTTEGTLHFCPPDETLWFDAMNYATTEARSRFGWHRFETSGPKFYFNTRYEPADVEFCEDTIGGHYITGHFLGSIQRRRGKCETYSHKKPTWERYERLPITNGAASPTIVPMCRSIKMI